MIDQQRARIYSAGRASNPGRFFTIPPTLTSNAATGHSLGRTACCCATVMLAVLVLSGPFLPAQQVPVAEPPAAEPATGPDAPTKVDVSPTADDDDIRERLTGILAATEWFNGTEVTVREGVVFLDGRTDDEQYKTWASNLARNTQDVVAVVNRIDVTTPAAWDFRPAWNELQAMGQGLIRALPALMIGVMLLPIAWGVARLASRRVRHHLSRRTRTMLLQEVAAKACGIFIFLLGLYLFLRLAGLSRLAVTVLGGTGLFGLVVGIAFRDITENFLASIFLSIHHPFREGDLVLIVDNLGYVQRLTSRSTVLMTLDGNHVQIPNAAVFKNTIRNFTSNPNRREDFSIGVGYDTSITQAQEIALRVLADHPAVLKDPEPWVLVESLGSATVVLRVFFWLDGSRFSWLKVRSSVIRQVKRAFQDAEIALPDEAREVIFPKGIEVRMQGRVEEAAAAPAETRPHPGPRPAPVGTEAVSTPSEGGLVSEAKDIQEQARRAWTPEQDQNLLGDEPAPLH